MRNYYIVKNGASTGPFSLDQLKNQYILPETKVWYEGLPEWMEAKAMPELSELFPKSMAVPPPINNKESERLARSTFFWKVVNIVLIALVVIVGYSKYKGLWPFGNKTVENNIVVGPKPIEPSPIDPKPDPKPITQDLKELVHAELDKSKIKYNDFGGMSEVFVLVTNDSDTEIDVVNVRATYLLQSGKTWKSDVFPIYDVPAKGSSLSQIDGSHRGVKVNIEIADIIVDLDFIGK